MHLRAAAEFHFAVWMKPMQKKPKKLTFQWEIYWSSIDIEVDYYLGAEWTYQNKYSEKLIRPILTELNCASSSLKPHKKMLLAIYFGICHQLVSQNSLVQQW